MLVGDVRCARTGFGSSWKLSGGRKWSSGPTNASKNRHVRRAVERRRVTSSGASGDVARARGGRLIHRATSGERPQSRTNGAAMAQLPGLTKTTRAAATAASRTAPRMLSKRPVTSRDSVERTWAAGVHSSSCRRVTYSRPRVRAIASLISQA